MNLLRLATKPIERLAEYSALRRNRLDKTLVQQPHRARRLYVRTLVQFAVVLAGWAFYSLTSSDASTGWQHSVLGVLLGAYLGTTALGHMARPIAYRAGWLDGRATMVSALGEAQRRGLSPDDWLRGQWEVDATVLGLPVHLPEGGEDL